MSQITSQKNLDLTITSTLGEDKLIVDELTVDESLHELFDIRIIAHSTDINIDLQETLGKNMTVSLNLHSGKRHFSGIVARFEQLHTTVLEKQKKLIAFYQIRLVPKLWLLTQSKDYRIFQNKSVKEIIKEVLSDSKVTEFTYKTKKGTEKKREYCVQYGESNFDFVARLCEEEGIFFHFEHDSSVHKLFFNDNESVPEKIGEKGYPYAQRSPSTQMMNHIYECISCEQITTKELQVTDYDYLKPAISLSGKASGKELGGKHYEYPGLFDNAGDGTKRAKSHLEALNWSKQFIQGSSSAPDLMPYKKFSLLNHPRKSLNADYVVYRVKHTISQTKIDNLAGDSGYDRMYENQFWAHPVALPFTPIQKHEKKRIHSLQTATVTGPSGEEIYTDKYGRIKVKFHWDTRGKKDDKSSCWIRVAQNWSGSKWGGLVIPRVKMEVVVSFLDGDPDRPLVMGCVYNGESLPPYASENPTRSTFKTSSSKGNKGFNELRFEDKADKEEIFIHAQKDLNLEIENDRTEKIIKGNDSLLIQKGNRVEKLEGKGTKYSTEITDGDQTLEITKGDQKIDLIKGDQKITLTKGDQKITLLDGKHEMMITKGDMKITLTNGKMDIIVAKGAINITAKEDIKMTSAGKIVMTGAKGIEMNSPKGIDAKAGADFNVQSGANVEIKAGAKCGMQAPTIIQKGVSAIQIESGGVLELKGSAIMTDSKGMQQLKSSGILELKGSMLKLN